MTSVLFTVPLGSGSHLSQVAEVVSLHLQVEDFALCARCFGDQIFVEQVLRKEMWKFNSKEHVQHTQTAAVISEPVTFLTPFP